MIQNIILLLILFLSQFLREKYKLILKNISDSKHYFSSNSFSKSIFTRKIQINSNGKKLAEIKGVINEVEVWPNHQIEWWLVPIKTGRFEDLFCKVEDMKNAIIELLNANNDTEIINIRPGEKRHEMLINRDEIRSTFENEDDYIIINDGNKIKNRNSDLRKTSLNDEYSSDKVELLSKEELKIILSTENLV